MSLALVAVAACDHASAPIACCTPRFADTATCDPNVHVQPNRCLVERRG